MKSCVRYRKSVESFLGVSKRPCTNLDGFHPSPSTPPSGPVRPTLFFTKLQLQPQRVRAEGGGRPTKRRSAEKFPTREVLKRAEQLPRRRCAGQANGREQREALRKQGMFEARRLARAGVSERAARGDAGEPHRQVNERDDRAEHVLGKSLDAAECARRRHDCCCGFARATREERLRHLPCSRRQAIPDLLARSIIHL